MHELFQGFLPVHHFADRPPAGFAAPLDPTYLEHLDAVFARHAPACAAFICEPVVQGAGGMHFYNPAYLSALRERCDRYGLLLIFDEIATGFGRTGRMFAAEHAGVVPDVMTLGKALTGGYLTLAATVCGGAVAETIGRGAVKALMHGPTFMGNPLACAVAVASLDLLQASLWQERVTHLADLMNEHLAAARGMRGVKDVRVLGAIGVIETTQPVDVAEIQRYFVGRGVWIRPFGTRVYVMPPYVITDEQLIRLCRAMVSWFDR